jgi:hypothetical protein
MLLLLNLLAVGLWAQAILAQDAQSEITVMLKYEPSVQDVQTTLVDFDNIAKDIIDRILKKYSAGLGPVFEGSSGTSKPALARFYSVRSPPSGAQDINSVITELRQHKDVQTAYLTPPATVAGPVLIRSLRAPNVTVQNGEARISPLLVDQQGYLLAGDAGGLDIIYANDQPGGRGDGVKVFDVEYAWDKEHEDLLLNFPEIIGLNIRESPGLVQHGTAVAGVIGGDINTFGVNGIAPNALFYGSSVARATLPNQYNVALAIQTAADRASPGDVILLEQQREWSPGGIVPKYIAVEWWPQDYQAILDATNRGIVVVEAGGNGFQNSRDGQNFDDPAFVASRYRPNPPVTPGNPDTSPFGNVIQYPNPFDPLNPSSGAILVGAGSGGGPSFSTDPDRSRLDFSAYGLRVDVQAWGNNIVTTSFLVPNMPNSCNLGTTILPPGVNQCYTRTFGGTSGASAIIAGVVASVQGVVKAARKKPLTSKQFIQLFRNPNTGLAQVSTVSEEERLLTCIDELSLKTSDSANWEFTHHEQTHTRSFGSGVPVVEEKSRQAMLNLTRCQYQCQSTVKLLSRNSYPP